jgi:ribosome-binding protein aMBF1 (putative translation factor)
MMDKTTIRKEIGEVLRQARDDAGLFQWGVQGWSSDSIRSLERGLVTPDIIELHDLCRALGISFTDTVAKLEAIYQRHHSVV